MADPKRGEASAEAVEAARRFYWGSSIEAGLDSQTDAAERRDGAIRRTIELHAEFGDAFAAARVRAAVERCCAAVRAVQEKYILKDSAGEYLTDESRIAEECEAAIRAAFAPERRESEEGGA